MKSTPDAEINDAYESFPLCTGDIEGDCAPTSSQTLSTISALQTEIARLVMENTILTAENEELKKSRSRVISYLVGLSVGAGFLIAWIVILLLTQ